MIRVKIWRRPTTCESVTPATATATTGSSEKGVAGARQPLSNELLRYIGWTRTEERDEDILASSNNY